MTEPTSRLERRNAERAKRRRRNLRIRYGTVAAVAVLALIAGILIATSGHGGRIEPAAPRPNACAPAVNRLSVLPVGDAAGDIFGTATPSELKTYAYTAALIGLDHIRADFGLSTAQWKPGGKYHWDTFCQIARAASKRGLKIHAILDQLPGWMKQDPRELAQACLSFAKTFANSNVTAIEFENEPNVHAEYAWHPDVYMARYAACYKPIHQVAMATHWNVIFEPGGTAPVGTEDHSKDHPAVRPDTWYASLYGFGLGNMSCNTALHPYDWPMDVTPKDPAWNQVNVVHGIMARNHHSHCRVDITEMGFPTAGGKRPPATARYPEWHDAQPVSVLNQARFTTDALNAWYPLYKQGIAGSFDIFSLVDNPHADGTEAHFGVYLALNGNPLLPGLTKNTGHPYRSPNDPASTVSSIQIFLAQHAPETPPAQVVKAPGPASSRAWAPPYVIVLLPDLRSTRPPAFGGETGGN